MHWPCTGHALAMHWAMRWAMHWAMHCAMHWAMHWPCIGHALAIHGAPKVWWVLRDIQDNFKQSSEHRSSS
eukprot:11156503-Lingulodinium_polyedra.AAC.1